MEDVKPLVFIGSSTEGLKIAEEIQVLLEHACDSVIWSQGTFESEITLNQLTKSVEKYDFAILVLTPDDTLVSREDNVNTPRDNVLFELGLFVGGLGIERTIMVCDRDKKIKLPTDLAGFTPVTFRVHSNEDLRASLGSCCTKIRKKTSEVTENERKDLNAVTAKVKDLENQKEFLIAELSKATGSNTIPIMEAKIVHVEKHYRDLPPVFILVFYINNLGKYPIYDVNLGYPKDRHKYKVLYDRRNWEKHWVGVLDIGDTYELEMTIEHPQKINPPYLVEVKWRGGFKYTYSFHIDVDRNNFYELSDRNKIINVKYTYKGLVYHDIDDVVKSISNKF